MILSRLLVLWGVCAQAVSACALAYWRAIGARVRFGLRGARLLSFLLILSWQGAQTITRPPRSLIAARGS